MTGVDPVFASAFDNAPIGMAVLAPDGVIQRCNPAVGALLGRAHDELVGDTFFSVTHPDDLDEAMANCLRMQQDTARIVRHECRFLRANASVVWVSVTTSRVPAVEGFPAHLVMHIEDVDDRKVLEAELRHGAQHDPLTGLGNRALLLDGIRRTADRRACLLYLDLDGFKSVNDRFGHGAGDGVLCELAERIRALLEPEDVAARLGGDEFVVLRPGGVPERTARLVEDLHRAVGVPFLVDGHRIVLGAAIGSARSEPGEVRASGPEVLLDRADRHMYRMKRPGPVG